MSKNVQKPKGEWNIVKLVAQKGAPFFRKHPMKYSRLRMAQWNMTTHWIRLIAGYDDQLSQGATRHCQSTDVAVGRIPTNPIHSMVKRSTKIPRSAEDNDENTLYVGGLPSVSWIQG